MVEPAEAVIRLLIVFLLAFGIGLERQLRRKPVGFGTFIFVSTGACALAILAVDLGEQNPLPLLGGVITGIGFLGAGALIRSNDRVFGFTTAALVWAMAALGVAAGAGLYYLAFANYGIVWAVVITDRYLESKGFGSHAKVVHLTVANPISVDELDALLPTGRAEFEKVRIDKEAHLVSVTAQVRVKPGDVEALLEGLRRNDKVRAFEIE
jgi:putative Mg2+ transporter-C (MgtC) family protein